MSKKLIIAVLLVVIIAIFGGVTEAGKNAAHIDINPYLLGMDGINPPSEDNPFSTKQTCTSSGCHNYEQITCGYHFQLCEGTYPADNEPDYDKKDHWMYSKWCALPNRLVIPGVDPSGKTFDDYEYTKTCGICHPGAGPMEFNIDGTRHEEGGFADGNVVEASCLMCHQQQGYDHMARNKNIVAGRFSIANAAGMGFYDEDGNYMGTHIPFAIGAPSDKSCNHCHAAEPYDHLVMVTETKNAYDFEVVFKKPKCDIYKRGFIWCLSEDVHYLGGMSCIDCHSSFREHQISKGGVLDCTVANSLDFARFQTCSECHSSGNTFNAPIPNHDRLPSDHLETISCQTCHIPEKKFAAFDYMDWSTGDNRVKGAVVWKGGKMKPDEMAVGGFSFQDIDGFKPTYAWFNAEYNLDQNGDPWLPSPSEKDAPGGMIMPFNTVVVRWWDVGYDEDTPQEMRITEENKNTSYLHGHTVNPADVVKAAKNIPDFTSDVNGNGTFDIGDITDDKLTALSEEIRKEYPNAVIREVPIFFSLSHNVASSEDALGNSCTDCHSPDAHFFFGSTRVQIGDGEDAFIPMYANLGYSISEVNLHGIREIFVKPFFIWLTLIILGLILLHFISFGRKRFSLEEGEKPTILRHGGFKRFIHLANIISFVVLVLTGFSRMFSPNLVVDWLFGSDSLMMLWHKIFGFVFAVSLVVAFIMWVKDSCFKKEDWQWLKALGGYIKRRDDLPAHKFNAGQKLYFWVTIFFGLLMIVSGLLMMFLDNPLPFTHSLHATLAVVFLAVFLAHLYLSIFANQRTIRAIFVGTVYPSWVKKFHPLWKYEKKG